MTSPRPRLVLASASPARLATLRSAGIEPLVRVPNVDEEAVVAAAQAIDPSLTPADIALLLARAKAEAGAASLSGDAASALVLGCDSVLELGGRAYGKPAGPSEARTRWRDMRGRAGILHTGHWLIDSRDPAAGGSRGTTGSTASTRVWFADLDDREIAAYVATGEPMQVAGGFTVDGLGGAFVTRIEGDYHNVVGLSLPLLRELLRDIGVGWFDLASPAATDQVSGP